MRWTIKVVKPKTTQTKKARVKNSLSHLNLGVALLVLLAPKVDAQWTQAKDITSGTVYAFTVSGSSIFAGTVGGGGVYLSTDGGINWKATNAGLPATCAVWSLATNGGNIFIGTADSGVFLSTNNGTSWREANSGLTDLHIEALAASGSRVFAGTDNGVFLSTDNGISWPLKYVFSENVYSFAVTGNNFYAGTTSGNVWILTDTSTSWTQIATNGIPIPSSVAVSNKTLFTGTFGVSFLNYNGKSWDIFYSGPPNCVVSLTADSTNIYAGTDKSVFVSSISSPSWKEFNAGLPNRCIWALAAYGDFLFAGPDSSGLWQRPISEIAGVVKYDAPQKTPKQVHFGVSCHADNNVSINFSLPHSEQVAAKICNLSGCEVASLFDKTLGPGSYQYLWDARRMAAGCYSMRLRIGAKTFIKSIILAR
jgi:hypothetical protein